MIPRDYNRRLDSGIDEVLRAVGSANPPEGIEGRILTRLASERLQMGAYRSGPVWLAALRGRFSLQAMGVVSGGLVCAILVAGSVSYSHRAHAGPVAVPPPIQLPSQGIGAASAVHAGAPPSAPVSAGPTSRGRSSRRVTRGRARVSPHLRKAPGVAVPVPTSAPEN